MDVIRASKDDREWSFVSPKEYFHSDEDEMGTLQITSTEENNQKSNQQSIDENVILEGEIEFLDLETAFWEATMHRWKSRWLLLDRKLASKGSGIWQCWLEGIDLYKNKSDKVRMNNNQHIFSLFDRIRPSNFEINFKSCMKKS